MLNFHGMLHPDTLAEHEDKLYTKPTGKLLKEV